MTDKEAREYLERVFPRLHGTLWEIKSQINPKYNCVAWVMGDTSNWWEPDPFGLYYWPKGLSRGDYSLDAYRAMFESLGYTVCCGEGLEPGHPKVAILDDHGRFKHVIRQEESGAWTSKLGPDWDIEHPVGGLYGTLYGTARIFLRRDS